LLWLGSRRTARSQTAQPDGRSGSCQGAALGEGQAPAGALEKPGHPGPGVPELSYPYTLSFIKIKLYFFGLGRLAGWCVSCWPHALGPKTAGI